MLKQMLNRFSSPFPLVFNKMTSISLFPFVCKHEAVWFFFYHASFNGFHFWCWASPIRWLTSSSPDLTSWFAQTNEFVLSWCQHFARPAGWGDIPGVFGDGSGLQRSATICLGRRVLTALSTVYSSACSHAPHTQCFMQYLFYNDASLVFDCVCVTSLWELLCAFLLSEIILAFFLLLQEASLGRIIDTGLF